MRTMIIMMMMIIIIIPGNNVACIEPVYQRLQRR